MKPDVPVHAAAKRLVQRRAAAAQADMLPRCAGVPGDRHPILIDQLDMAGGTTGHVLRDFDLRRPVDVGQAGVALRTDADPSAPDGHLRTAYDEIIEARAARRDERLLAEMKHGVEPVGAEGLECAQVHAIVEHMGLLPGIDLALVGHAPRISASVKPRATWLSSQNGLVRDCRSGTAAPAPRLQPAHRR